MKKFLLKLFWFIFPILLIAYPLEFFISYNLKKSNDREGEFQVWNDIYDGKANCDIAIYGSSRAAININPEILEDTLHKKTYNFGIVGHGFWMQYLRHIELFNHNDKPKQIILSLDTYSLTTRLKYMYGVNQFLPYLFLNANMQSYTSRNVGYSDNGFTFFDYYLPLLRYQGQRESLSNAAFNMFKSENEIYKLRKNGHFRCDKEWDEELDKRVYIRADTYIGFDQPSVELFKTLIDECKNSGIDLILVFSPEYIEWQKSILNRNKVVDLYQQFADQNDLVYLDYSNDDMSYQKEFFFDSLHLNSKGTEIFTTKLATKLKEIGH